MRLCILFVVLLLSVCPVARAADPAAACQPAAAAAERDWGLPPGILGAIGRVESGRTDPLTRRTSPWPWTVNAAGSGFIFSSSNEAIAFVRAIWAGGVRLIDVGCFQIDLFYHPAAFNSLQQAFDPVANAGYAARFLTVLHDQTGDWRTAVALYHSSDARAGETYRRQVMRQWDVAAFAGTEPMVTAHAMPGDRHVVVMSDLARAIPVRGPEFRTGESGSGAFARQ